MTVRAVGNIGPAFEEDEAACAAWGIRMAAHRRGRGGFVDDIKSTLQADKVMPFEAVLFRELRQGFGALARAAHELFLGGWSVANATVHFQALLDGVELWATLAGDSDDNFGHSPPEVFARL